MTTSVVLDGARTPIGKLLGAQRSEQLADRRACAVEYD